jgi:MFS family permease
MGVAGTGSVGSRWPDLPGLLLISGGLVAATYGLAEAGSAAIRMWLPIAAGVALLAAFVVRSARIARPLLDVRLYRNRAYAASSLMNFAVGATVFGAMIIMPLYYQSVRNLDPVQTGLLVAPTGIGVALMTRLASSLTDRIGSGRTALAGSLIAAAGTVPFVLLGADTSYAWLSFAGLVRGAGIALVMIPAMTAVYRAIPMAKVSDGTTQVNVLNRLGGSTGTAVFTVVLQHALSSRGVIAAAPAAAAAAYGDAFRWVLGAAVLAALPALLLARAEGRPSRLAAQSEPPAVTTGLQAAGGAAPETATRPTPETTTGGAAPETVTTLGPRD